MLSKQVIYAQKRRSSRIDRAIPLAVQGVGAFRAPYREEVTTQSISCHGCTYQIKQEVLPGDVVFLDIGHLANGHAENSSRARVKWTQKIKSTKDQAFEVAVEFENAGNVWGIESPPADWFPVQEGKVAEPANPGRELRILSRTEPQIATPPTPVAALAPSYKKNDAAGSLAPSFSELMVGLGEQIQTMASETAVASLAKEKDRLLVEFRQQLQEEAAKSLVSVIASSKEELSRRLIKELNEAQEAAARSNYDRWSKAIEQSMEGAKQQLVVHGKEVGQSIDAMAATTMERLQRNIETSRGEAVDRFVVRLREQITPLLEEAKVDLQKLAASENRVKQESQAIYTQFVSQLESSVNARLAMAREELDKHSATMVNESNAKLLKLSEVCEKSARESLRSLVASAAEYTKKILQESSNEISGSFSTQLESYTRGYLESISESIAEIPRKIAMHSRE